MASSSSVSAFESRTWPFVEARKVVERYQQNARPSDVSTIFATGYGPSGLPHIGTFAEIVRTSMVRRAVCELVPDIKTRLICFSDDMDGLRKVPDNVPHQDMLGAHLECPLTSVPDPFGTHASFAAHNNARLRSFLDDLGFDYEFVSATEYYQSGQMDSALQLVLKHYQAVCDIIIPTLGTERAARYSPFLPLCPESGRILYVPLVDYDVSAGRIRYRHPDDGRLIETLITGGACKLQWKADWAMRWIALEVDYEMYGKDLAESAILSNRICKAVGGTTPIGFAYEMFLDAQGKKISKSLGNGLSVEEWCTYAPNESLAFYMYQNPRRAKRLYFEVIPKAVDDYLAALAQHATGDNDYENPAWYVHAAMGTPLPAPLPISFSLLLNLVSASNADAPDVLWGFINKYNAALAPTRSPLLDALVGYVLTFYRDFIAPHRKYHSPSELERAAMYTLLAHFEKLPQDADAQSIQNETYAVGKEFFSHALGAWFSTLYRVLLGQHQGPRFGSFVALYGLDKTIALLRARLEDDIET